ncbi:Type 2 glycosyltransferase [Hypoxylon texense]
MAVRPIPLSAGLSPSAMSPRTLPSPNPIHPASYDGSMQRQDRALVDSFDQRAKHVVTNAPLTPIDEYTPSPLVARLEKISILPPMSLAHGATAPASPGLSPRRDSQRFIEAPVSGRTSLPVTPARSPNYLSVNDMSPPSSRRSSVLELRDQLRTWGHVYYGNAKSADAFIIARSLRRTNGTSADTTKDLDYRQGPPNTPASPSPPKRLTVRAIVRPRALDRPSFLIQRNFDVEQLRATVPEPPRYSNAAAHSPTSPLAHGHHLAAAQTRSRRSSSVQSSTLLRSGAGSIDLDGLMRDAKAVPIHLKYARVYLPVIAALLSSGHVHEGDVIYLPMPHAEAWPQTAQYVYTGQGELTDAVRENILYLAGKV